MIAWLKKLQIYQKRLQMLSIFYEHVGIHDVLCVDVNCIYHRIVVLSQVILDLVDYPSILVRRIQKKNVDKFGITKYPSLYIINKDSSFQHLAR